MEGLPANVLPISLGYNCHIRSCIDILFPATGFSEDKQRCPFDWIGTPMWAICRILTEDFKDFATTSLIQQRQRYMHTKQLYPTHSLYNTVFLHDIPNKETEEKYARRIERFRQILTSGRPLFFLRLEESTHNRIVRQEFSQYVGDELSYIRQFLELMKERGVICAVLQITSKVQTPVVEAEGNLLRLPIPKHSSTVYSASGIQLANILRNHSEFIKEHLQFL